MSGLRIDYQSLASSIKVITITGLIILGIVLDLGGKFSMSCTILFLAFHVAQAGLTMIDLDSDIGRIRDRLYNLTTLAVPKDASSHFALS